MAALGYFMDVLINNAEISSIETPQTVWVNQHLVQS
jgi:hypothetical protein